MKKLLDRDFLGVLASIICLIHCLCLPWLLMISGAWLSSYLSTPWFHHLMLAVAMLIGLPVFISSYLKYKSKSVLILGSFGLALTSYGTLQEDPCCPTPNQAGVSKNIELSECEIACASEGSSCDSETRADTIVNLNTPSATEFSECEIACASEGSSCESETRADTIVNLNTPSATEFSECEIACASEGSSCESETSADATVNSDTTNQSKNETAISFLSAGLKSVPLGVAFILIAHILNFRHRSICKKNCCETNL